MKRFLLFSLGNLMIVSLIAQSGYNINYDSTAVPFLGISPDSRAGGMGDGGVACANDPNAIHWNLSNLAFARRKFAVGISYTPWLRALLPDVDHAYVSFYVKPDSVSAIAASLRYFSMGNVNFIGGAGMGNTQYKPSEFAIDFGYTRKLSSVLSAGITGRYIMSNINSNRTMLFSNAVGRAFSADISLSWKGRQSHRVTPAFGLCLSNVGTRIWYYDRDSAEYLPTNIRAGGALVFSDDKVHQITLHGEANRLLAPDPVAVNTTSEKLGRITLSAGGEYAFRSMFKVRTGYFHQFKSYGYNRYLTAGVGIEYSVFQLDFSYLIPVGTLRSPLENTLRFTLLFNFDALRNPAANIHPGKVRSTDR